MFRSASARSYLPLSYLHFTLALFALCGFAALEVRAQDLPPVDADYVDEDPAAQRVESIDANSGVAIDALQAALRREPRNYLLKLQNAQLLAERGLRTKLSRELSLAQRVTEEGSVERRRVHYNAGWLLFGLGDFESAESEWVKAFREHGGRPSWVPEHFAMLLWSRGHREMALDYFGRALNAQPQRWGSEQARAAALEGLPPNARFALESLYDTWQRERQ
jgi:tetratricopeptide (TPR) repeat protein